MISIFNRFKVSAFANRIFHTNFRISNTIINKSVVSSYISYEIYVYLALEYTITQYLQIQRHSTVHNTFKETKKCLWKPRVYYQPSNITSTQTKRREITCIYSIFVYMRYLVTWHAKKKEERKIYDSNYQKQQERTGNRRKTTTTKTKREKIRQNV